MFCDEPRLKKLSNLFRLPETLLSSLSDGRWAVQASYCSAVLYIWSLTVRPRLPKLMRTYNFKHHPLSTATPPNVTSISPILRCLGGDYEPVMRSSLGYFTPSTGSCGCDRSSETAKLCNWAHGISSDLVVYV